MLKTITGGICAGLLVSIGGTVFLSCDKYIGAALFSVALICICYLGFYLFTGRIGYAADDYSGKNVATLAVGLAANLVTTFSVGMLLRYVMPSLGNAAEILCTGKLEQDFLMTFIRAVFCGILMYLAVETYKTSKSPLGICFCIPVFILCGFEHSVADMYYFGASGIFDIKVVTFEIAAVLGNTVGSLLLPILVKVGKLNDKKAG